MARPLAHLTDEELRAQLQTTPAPQLDAPRGMEAVARWAVEYGVFPGRHRAIEAQDLYRHFLSCGYRLSGFGPDSWEFGSALNRLGLKKIRLRTGGVNKFQRLLTEEASLYFRAWLNLNPCPPGTRGFKSIGRTNK